MHCAITDNKVSLVGDLISKDHQFVIVIFEFDRMLEAEFVPAAYAVHYVIIGEKRSKGGNVLQIKNVLKNSTTDLTFIASNLRNAFSLLSWFIQSN
jgi:hypothetical protein